MSKINHQRGKRIKAGFVRPTKTISTKEERLNKTLNRHDLTGHEAENRVVIPETIPEDLKTFLKS